jgi:hypothetical protein
MRLLCSGYVLGGFSETAWSCGLALAFGRFPRTGYLFRIESILCITSSSFGGPSVVASTSASRAYSFSFSSSSASCAWLSIPYFSASLATLCLSLIIARCSFISPQCLQTYSCDFTANFIRSPPVYCKAPIPSAGVG